MLQASKAFFIKRSKAFLIRRQIKTLGEAALHWLWTNRSGFEVAASSGEEIPWRIKPLVELVLLLTVMRRRGFRPAVREQLAGYALEIAAGFDWHQLGAYDPSAATPLLLLAKFFTLEGQPLPFEQSFLSYLTRIRYFEGTDRLPYREMDYAYSLGLVGNCSQEQTLSRWFSHTAFGQHQHLTRYTIDDLYSLTHALFYLTDFGLRRESELLDSHTSCRLKKELVDLTAIMLRADNSDILSELMLCWLLCEIQIKEPDRNRMIFDRALMRVSGLQTAEGAIAPTSAIHGRSKTSGASFGELYHTTLVVALLFSLYGRSAS